ncbi:MAG: hypothetical protein ACP5N1_05200 [Candidatus Woesearchaeota archaeon]
MFKNTKGVTNTTIATLVMVSLLVSIVGTWLVLETFQTKYVATQVDSRTQESGLVRLNIDKPAVEQSTGISGLVSINIE